MYVQLYIYIIICTLNSVASFLVCTTDKPSIKDEQVAPNMSIIRL